MDHRIEREISAYVAVGDVGLSVTDPRGHDVAVTTEAMPNNAFKVGFAPTQPGIYDANVYFGDQQVPGSPFQVLPDSFRQPRRSCLD